MHRTEVLSRRVRERHNLQESKYWYEDLVCVNKYNKLSVKSFNFRYSFTIFSVLITAKPPWIEWINVPVGTEGAEEFPERDARSSCSAHQAQQHGPTGRHQANPKLGILNF